MNGFICANYKISWQHPDSSTDDWQIFLIGEHHKGFDEKDWSIGKVNAEFVNTFSNPNGALLLEAVPSLRSVTTLEGCAKLITTSNISSDRFIGWDSSTIQQTQLQVVAYRSVTHILKKVDEVITKCIIEGKRTNLRKINFINAYDKSTASPELKTVVKEAFIPIQQIFDAIICPAEERRNLMLENLEKTEGELEKIEIAPNPDFDKNANKLLELIDKSREISLSIFDMSARIDKELTSCISMCTNCEDDLIDSTFDERTTSMISTLQEVRTVTGATGKNFLFAGTAHLEKNPKLTPLYEFLKLRKDIVVLTPKLCAVDLMELALYE